MNLNEEDLRLDEDVLDTLFSSWLWPISVFDGINDPNNKEINYYYPTQDLVTGPDIIFFWVARDRKSTRLNSSHVASSYAVFCLKKNSASLTGDSNRTRRSSNSKTTLRWLP